MMHGPSLPPLEYVLKLSSYCILRFTTAARNVPALFPGSSKPSLEGMLTGKETGSTLKVLLILSARAVTYGSCTFVMPVF